MKKKNSFDNNCEKKSNISVLNKSLKPQLNSSSSESSHKIIFKVKNLKNQEFFSFNSSPNSINEFSPFSLKDNNSLSCLSLSFSVNENSLSDSEEQEIITFNENKKPTYHISKNNHIRKAPKIRPKNFFSIISPLMLDKKGKSCSNTENQDYFYENNIIQNNKEKKQKVYEINELFSEDEDTITQRTTPNQENFENLAEFRKKFKLIKENYEKNKKKLNEYENILHSSSIFNFYGMKKNSFWLKYIKKQKRLSETLKQINNINIINNDNINNKNEDDNNIKKTLTFKNNSKNSGLFILGILETAANERKKRKSSGFVNSNKFSFRK